MFVLILTFSVNLLRYGKTSRAKEFFVSELLNLCLLAAEDFPLIKYKISNDMRLFISATLNIGKQLFRKHFRKKSLQKNANGSLDFINVLSLPLLAIWMEYGLSQGALE